MGVKPLRSEVRNWSIVYIFFVRVNKMANTHKSQRGQFYTTQCRKIFQNMTIPSNIVHIIEPFAGKGDLVKFAREQDGGQRFHFSLYDIEPKFAGTVQQDTLLHPPSYENQFILTNPPFLARNKNPDKTIYDQYVGCNDLYKCFLSSIMATPVDRGCVGGLIILPVNFLCSIRVADIRLRERFFNRFHVQSVNIFEESVFDDTKYSVCSLLFMKKSGARASQTQITMRPSNDQFTVKFDSENRYSIGGEIYQLSTTPSYSITRATSKNATDLDVVSNVLLKCIDDSASSHLGFKIVEDDKKADYVDQTEKLSQRSYAILIFQPSLTMREQKDFVLKCNEFLKTKRRRYRSLFLTNYRESNTIARKRISFQLGFRIGSHILQEMFAVNNMELEED